MPRRKTISVTCVVVAECAAVLVTPLLMCLVAPLHAGPPTSRENNKAAQQVRTALKSEADQGAKGDRRKLLAEVVEWAADYAPARWHSGYVYYDGKWQSPDEVQTQASADPRLQQYRRLRAEALPTVADHVALAQWCRKNKLETEERVEWLRVLEGEPNHAEALTRLHLRRIGGMLLTPEQHQRYLSLRRKVDDDIKTWKPRVTAWQRAIESGAAEERQAALEKLSQVTDPTAAMVLEWSVRSKDLSHRALEFRLAVVAVLAAMRNQRATESLVRIAATAIDPEVCNAGSDALKTRSIPSYAPLLLAAMTSPVESEFAISYAGGNVFYRHQFFRSGADINDYAESNTVISIVGREVVEDIWDEMRMLALKAAVTEETIVEANVAASSTEVALAKQNQIIRERNQRLKYILTRATGIDLPSDPEKWWNWWQGYNEVYAGEKPLRDWSDDRDVSWHLRVFSCLGRGTPVWTITGKKPIESIQVGDRVLSQSP